jgi:hypothetical protein
MSIVMESGPNSSLGKEQERVWQEEHRVLFTIVQSLIDVIAGGDEREVGERLRVVAQSLACWSDFFSIEANVVAIGQHFSSSRRASSSTAWKSLLFGSFVLLTYVSNSCNFCQDNINRIKYAYQHNRETLTIPTEQALQEFEQIVQAIVSPPKLISKLEKDKTIQLFSPSDPLITALRHMEDNDYSQVVVQAEGKELSLLTVEGVARWLEKQAKDEVISLRDAHIDRVSR